MSVDNPSMPAFKVIILDFDGTLVESVGIKDQAFRDLYEVYPDKLDEIMEYHLSHNHTIRFEKFEHIHTKILHLEYDEQVREHLSSAFAKLVFNQIVQCPWVHGAEEFLRFCKGAGVPLYLVSMSPDDELLRILEARGIKDSFEKIYASPWSKSEAIADILAREEVDAEKAVYIGDAPEDGLAAAACGVRFLGRYSGRPLNGVATEVFSDMDEVRCALVRSMDVR